MTIGQISIELGLVKDVYRVQSILECAEDVARIVV